MTAEIELKAHITDSEALKLLLKRKAEYLSEFVKQDTYWFFHENRRGLRIRKEKLKFPDGSEKALSFATYKEKTVQDGIEINNEREFEVQPAEEFEEFLSRLGFKVSYTKQKRGWAFTYEGINAELLEVEGLGWFIELEILAGVNDASAIAEGKKRLLGFLDSLGIKREAVESRFYSELLGVSNT